ncbi:MAG TPA: YlxR family protein [Anaerolineaceae bacterium]|nr:YlxR family protein [Anaerolineaceae bacterium]
MAAKSRRKPKHVPQRTCVGCREVMPKRNLIRLVRTEQGVVVDPTSKLAGRGAYLHDDRSCWAKGLKGPLANALRTALTEQDMVALNAYMETLPVETEKTEASTDNNNVS